MLLHHFSYTSIKSHSCGLLSIVVDFGLIRSYKYVTDYCLRANVDFSVCGR